MPQTPQKRAEQLALSGSSATLGELESVLDQIAMHATPKPATRPPAPDSAEDEEMAMLMAELQAEEERAQRLQVRHRHCKVAEGRASFCQTPALQPCSTWVASI